MTSKRVQRPGAEDLRPEAFFDLRDVQHARLFQGTKYAWEALARLPRYVVETFDALKSGLLSEGRLQTSGPGSVKVSGGNGLVIKPPGLELPTDLWVDGELIIEEGVKIGPFCRISGRNYLATEAVLESHVVLDGNNLVGSGCHLGPFSYLRGSVILGARSHVRAEIKDSVLLDAISVPDPVEGGIRGQEDRYVHISWPICWRRGCGQGCEPRRWDHVRNDPFGLERGLPPRSAECCPGRLRRETRSAARGVQVQRHRRRLGKCRLRQHTRAWRGDWPALASLPTVGSDGLYSARPHVHTARPASGHPGKSRCRHLFRAYLVLSHRCIDG